MCSLACCLLAQVLAAHNAAEGKAAKAAESAKEMQEEVKLGYDLRVDALRKELAADAGRRAELEANMQVSRLGPA